MEYREDTGSTDIRNDDRASYSKAKQKSGRAGTWLAVSAALNIVLAMSLTLSLFGKMPALGMDNPSRPPWTGASSSASIVQGENEASAVDLLHPLDGYSTGLLYGDTGPELVEAGAIDLAALRELYQQSGAPLTAVQEHILAKRSDEEIIFQRDNARFLLHLLWAFGLTNQNTVLTEGMMWTSSNGAIERFASTGGWTLSAKPVTELYASAPLVKLTPGQQERLEAVASNVYRPCCNNPTSFPDCNHGIAMLGLLQLLAAQDATESEMYRAAKYANAFWFPAQVAELAVFFKAVLDQPYDEVDPRMAVGPEAFSGSGFASVHRWLGENGYLGQSPGQGSSCGV